MYTNLSTALTRAKERASLTTSEGDSFLTDYLNIFTGVTPTNVIHYRPFAAAANYLEQSPQYQQLSQAGDVKFTQMKTAIQSLYSLQNQYDVTYQLTVASAANGLGGAIYNFSSYTLPNNVVW